jgi:Glycosyltransferases involved in cell wall biogenesis
MKIEQLTKDFELTVLLPALNEEESIEKIIDEIESNLKIHNINYCILVCDNGSNDKTLEICKRKKVLINEVDQKGYGSNLKDAISKIKSKYIIFLEGDGSYNPSEIIKI